MTLPLSGNNLSIMSKIGLPREIAISTIVGGLIIAIIIAICSPSYSGLLVREFEDARGSSVYKQRVDCKSGALAKLGKQEQAIQSVKCDNEAEQHRLATNDLIQQTRAADAAGAQADLAAQSVRLAFLQTIAGILTLLAAFVAALYAKRAADTAKSADERERQISAKVDRPWLSPSIAIVGDLKADVNGTKFRVEAIIENIGNQPAHCVTSWVEIYQGSGIDTLAQVKERVEKTINANRQRVRDGVRTVLPGKSIGITAPQSLKLGNQFQARALVYVKYTLPNGNEAYSWEAFSYQAKNSENSFVPITSKHMAEVAGNMRAKSLGMSHFE